MHLELSLGTFLGYSKAVFIVRVEGNPTMRNVIDDEEKQEGRKEEEGKTVHPGHPLTS